MKFIIEQNNLLESLRNKDYFNISLTHELVVDNFKNAKYELEKIFKELGLSKPTIKLKNYMNKIHYVVAKINEAPDLSLNINISTKSNEDLKKKENLFYDNIVHSISLNKKNDEILTIFNRTELPKILSEVEKETKDQKYIEKILKENPARAIEFWDRMKKPLKNKYAYLRADLI